jgi:hypothetical protein
LELFTTPLCSTAEAFPSFQDQVFTDPAAILNPYKALLAKNYYFPLSYPNSSENMEDLNEATSPTQHTSCNSPSSSTKKTFVTAEDSIETITELLLKMEEDELQVQT